MHLKCESPTWIEDYPYTQLPNQMSYQHAMTYFMWTKEK